MLFFFLIVFLILYQILKSNSSALESIATKEKKE